MVSTLEYFRSFLDFVHEATLWIPFEWFVWIPWIVVAVVVLAAILLRKSSKWRRGLGLALLLLLPLLYAAVNLMLFFYVMLWPSDPRWAVQRQQLEVADLPSPPNGSNVPFLDQLSGWASSFVDGVNSSMTTLENLSGDINTARSYLDAFAVGLPHLLYAAAGLLVAAVVLVCLLTWALIQLILLLNDVRLLMKERNERNRAAYDRQVEQAGHGDNPWPYRRAINFDMPGAYAQYAREQIAAQKKQLTRK